MYSALHEYNLECFTSSMRVIGTVKIPPDMRISDWLKDETNFVIFHNAVITVYGNRSAHQNFSVFAVPVNQIEGISLKDREDI